jgi:hypothetical protein
MMRASRATIRRSPNTISPEVEISIQGCGPMDSDWHGAEAVGAAIASNFQLVTEQKSLSWSG